MDVPKASRKIVPSGAKKKKGIGKVEEVLETAARILIDDGYGALSMRRVATKSNMTIGNLQYYFRTKDELWKALLFREARQFEESQSQWLADSSDQDPEGPLISAIEYLLIDQKNPRSCSIYWELWALSTHDAEADRVMREVYSSYVENIQTLIARARPDLGRSQSGRLATLAVALIEGISLFRGGQRPAFPHTRDIETDVKEAVMAMVRAR